MFLFFSFKLRAFHQCKSTGVLSRMAFAYWLRYSLCIQSVVPLVSSQVVRLLVKGRPHLGVFEVCVTRISIKF